MMSVVFISPAAFRSSTPEAAFYIRNKTCTTSIQMLRTSSASVILSRMSNHTASVHPKYFLLPAVPQMVVVNDFEKLHILLVEGH